MMFSVNKNSLKGGIIDLVFTLYCKIGAPSRSNCNSILLFILKAVKYVDSQLHKANQGQWFDIFALHSTRSKYKIH